MNTDSDRYLCERFVEVGVRVSPHLCESVFICGLAWEAS
jgi:hypothetical protein